MARKRKQDATAEGAGPVPMQPVDKPIICNPYLEPTAYWVYHPETGQPRLAPGRRPAGHWYRDESTAKGEQAVMLAEESFVPLEQVNRLRSDVKRWRESGYDGATITTRKLLRHWWRDDLVRRLFYCQLEAVETVIYLAEMRINARRTRFDPEFSDDGIVAFQDAPLEPELASLTRMACKMATGSGKTVVMAMLITWSFCNRGVQPSDVRFPSSAIVVCPNLTIKERLQVLRPEHPLNYYDEFELVPTELRGLLNSGRVLVANWHQFAPESEHAEGGSSYAVVNKGAESPQAFVRRVLGAAGDRGQVMVLNDEGHHAYRPKPGAESGLTGADRNEAKEENEAATVWVQGLDRINAACGVRFCVDLSATPFYFREGTGYPIGEPFPWIVSDFSLVDAIESGIVKIPRLPVDDSTGRAEPRYFRLWRSIVDELEPGQRKSGRSRGPKPGVVWEKAQDALLTLASQYKERLEYIEESSPWEDKTPPAMIIVCNDTELAEVFHREISGERLEQSGGSERARSKAARNVVYGQGSVFPDIFSNTEGEQRTIRIDSKMVKDDRHGVSRRQGEDIRTVVDTVGKPGEPGAQVRCVVSVQMLNEGWDANNVTHILGLRAFSSQLLCEQVVGRGLRRMDYTPDPCTGLLTEEYVDVYGIPFSVIPYKGRPKKGETPDDKPKHHVTALEERDDLELRFPNVEGYTFDLKRDLITADIAAMDSMSMELSTHPTGTFVKPQVGYEVGNPTLLGPGEFEEQNRDAYYASTHLQAIKFHLSRRIMDVLTGHTESDALQESVKELSASRQILFPQVFRLVDEYVSTKVDFSGVDPRELGLDIYMRVVAERIISAIAPNSDEGEPPLMPILNRYKPFGTTADVSFKTVAPVHSTAKSHLNQVVVDTKTWESAAAYRLEQSPAVRSYARNDRLGLKIGYEHGGVSHYYEPDFLVELANDTRLVLEIKGFKTNQDGNKHEAARRWVDAVNNWGQMGNWAFLECRNPQRLGDELAVIGGSTKKLVG